MMMTMIIIHCSFKSLRYISVMGMLIDIDGYCE